MPNFRETFCVCHNDWGTIYRIYLVKARIAVKQKNWTLAKQACTTAQELHIAYGHERLEVDALEEQIEQSKKGK